VRWVGESEKLLHILFEMARHYAPSTIFFDEIGSFAAIASFLLLHLALNHSHSHTLIRFSLDQMRSAPHAAAMASTRRRGA